MPIPRYGNMSEIEICKATGRKKRWAAGNKCPGYVYIFEIGYDNLYKIGWAKDYTKRLQELQAGNPRLKCVCAVRAGHAKREEWYLHWNYWDKHVQRELFRLTEKDLVDIFELLWARRLKECPKGIQSRKTISPT